MKFAKKLMLIVLIISLVSLNVSAKDKEETIIDENYESNVEFLKGLGILENVGLDIQNPQKEVSRSDFVVFAMNVGKIQIAGAKDNIFVDIKEDDSAKDNINMAVEMGYINGVDEIHFKPTQTATAGQAVKVYLGMLGYNTIAQQKGGYPYGYMKYNSQFKLYNGNFENNLTIKDLFEITANALEVPLLTIDTIGDDVSFSSQKDKTLLTEVYNVYKGDGQITANDINSLSNSLLKVRENYIEINKNLYDVGDTVIDDYLGYSVKYYYHQEKNQDKKTIKYFKVNEEKTRTLNLTYDDITRYDNGVLYYDNKNDKTENITIDSTANIIFNGKTNNEFTVKDAKFIMPNSTISLLDTNSDKKYDIVYVNVYITYLVSKVDKEDFTIVDTFGKNSIEFSKDEYDYKVIKNKKRVDFSEINVNDVLAISGDVLTADLKNIDLSKSTYLVFEILKGKVEGEVTEIGNIKKSTALTINDEKYKVSSQYLDLIKSNPTKYKEIVCGDKGAFYLDKFNHIFGFKIQSQSENYGYVTAMSKGKGLADEITLKIFMMDGASGAFYIVGTTDKVKYNNKTISASSLYDEAEFYDKKKEKVISQLITFKVEDSGKITSINIAENYTKSKEYIGYDNNKFSFDKSYESVTYRYSKMFGQRYILDGNTKIFIVPENMDSPDVTDKDFAIASKSIFKSDSSYKIDIYDADENAKVKVVLIKQSNEGIEELAKKPVSVVEKVATSVNEDGNEVIKLYCNENGKPTSVMAEIGEMVDKNKTWRPSKNGVVEEIRAEDLKKGDIIQYASNNKGEMTSFRCVFRLSDVDILPLYQVSGEKDGSPLGTNMGSVYTSLYIGYGDVIEATSAGILFNAQDVNDSVYNIYMEYGSAACMVYDKNTQKLKATTKNSIKKGDRLFVRIFAVDPQNLIIIK